MSHTTLTIDDNDRAQPLPDRVLVLTTFRDGCSLHVNVTDEGIIFDLWDDEAAELIGTRGMTYDEWADSLRPS